MSGQVTTIHVQNQIPLRSLRSSPTGPPATQKTFCLFVFFLFRKNVLMKHLLCKPVPRGLKVGPTQKAEANLGGSPMGPQKPKGAAHFAAPRVLPNSDCQKQIMGDHVVAIPSVDFYPSRNSKQDKPIDAVLELAAAQFDIWMHLLKTMDAHSTLLNHHGKALVVFLTQGKGFQYIKTYGELCDLSSFLKGKKYNRGKGYQTECFPCTAEEFTMAIQKCGQK